MISTKLFQKYANDPAAFREALTVDVDGIARRFGEVMDPWQRADFAALDPALMRAAGRSTEPAKMRAYLERPRGHSKTTDLAVTAVWALAFATRPLRGYCYAADQDQAALLKQAMETVLRLNPWLGQILESKRGGIENTAKGHPGEGGNLRIETSDVGSSFGILPDIIIADELTHWKGDGSLWHSLLSSAAKRSNCLLVTISNAGFAVSWQWAVREAARLDPDWIFSRLDGPVASWLTPERLAEQQRMLPAIAYARLWRNQWSTGGGDALTEQDINAAFLDSLQPMTGKESDYIFCGGLDLGLTRDCAALVVLGIPDGGRAGRIRLAHNRLWRPTLGKKINLIEVERHILDIDRQFGLENVAFDPWQAELLAQRLEADTEHRSRNARRLFGNKPWMREVPPTGANIREQATLVIESFVDHRFQFYDCEPLRQDLHKLRVEERSYGVRLTSPRDGDGHGDTFSAFALALLIGHELAGKKPVRVENLMGDESRAGQVSAWNARVDEYREEMALLERGGYDYSGRETFAAMMMN